MFERMRAKGQFRERNVNPDECVLVWQREMAAAKSGYLITANLTTCVTILAHNKREGTGFLAHIDDYREVFQAMHRASTILGISSSSRELLLYGGTTSEHSINIREEIRRHSEHGSFPAKITDKGMSRIIENSSQIIGTGASVGIDVRTGECFIPSNSTLEALKNRFVRIKVDSLYYRMSADAASNNPQLKEIALPSQIGALKRK